MTMILLLNCGNSYGIGRGDNRSAVMAGQTPSQRRGGRAEEGAGTAFVSFQILHVEIIPRGMPDPS
jgi:hypothetical protein